MAAVGLDSRVYGLCIYSYALQAVDKDRDVGFDTDPLLHGLDRGGCC